tara:strand:- start:759 stop:2516 length:1758 start_codon:yes stop_codon:yes gene_type:complete
LKKLSSKLIEFAGHGIFATLFVMAVLLYKERLFADASHYAFHTINSGFFHVEHGRIVLALSQIVPLIGYYLHLPLQWLLVLSSVGHEVFYYGIFLLLFYKLKDIEASIALLMIHLVGQFWTYFVPMLEISYGSALAILFYSLLRKNKFKDEKWWILLLIIEWFIMFSHPLNALFIPLILVYDFLRRGWQHRIHTSGWFFFVIAIIVRLLNSDSYDRGKVDMALESVSLGLFSGDYWIEVFELLITYYFDIIIFLVINVIALFFKKRFFYLALLFTSTISLLFLVSLIFPINQYGYYSEVLLLSVVFIVIFYTFFIVFETVNKQVKNIIVSIAVLIAIVRLIFILDSGKSMVQRIDQIDRLVDYTQTIESSKFLIRTENFEKKYSLMTWANPIEALLFSAIDGKNATRTIISEKDLNYQDNSKLINDTSFIFRMFELEPHSFLNERFFKLNKSPYIELNTSKYEVEASEIKDSVSVSFLHAENGLTFQKGDTVLHQVLITNKSGYKIPSAVERQTFIACHWFNEDGSVYRWDGIRTLFEVDIINQYTQDIKLAIPEEPGNYFLQADIVIEGKMWFELKDKVKVVVN